MLDYLLRLVEGHLIFVGAKAGMLLEPKFFLTLFIEIIIILFLIYNIKSIKKIVLCLNGPAGIISLFIFCIGAIMTVACYQHGLLGLMPLCSIGGLTLVAVTIAV